MKTLIELLGSLSLLVAAWAFLPGLKNAISALPNIAPPQVTAVPAAPRWIPISKLRSLQ